MTFANHWSAQVRSNTSNVNATNAEETNHSRIPAEAINANRLISYLDGIKRAELNSVLEGLVIPYPTGGPIRDDKQS